MIGNATTVVDAGEPSRDRLSRRLERRSQLPGRFDAWLTKAVTVR